MQFKHFGGWIHFDAFNDPLPDSEDANVLLKDGLVKDSERARAGQRRRTIAVMKTVNSVDGDGDGDRMIIFILFVVYFE